MSFMQTVLVIIFVTALYVFNEKHKSFIGAHVKFEKDYNVYLGTVVSEMFIKKKTKDKNKTITNKYKLFEVDIGQKDPVVVKREKLIIMDDYNK